MSQLHMMCQYMNMVENGYSSPGSPVPRAASKVAMGALKVVRTSGEFPIYLKEKDRHNLRLMFFLFPALVVLNL